MDLSLEGSGISYEPGDVIGVRCPNPVEATAYILERLQVSFPFYYMANSSINLFFVLWYVLTLLSVISSVSRILPHSDNDRNATGVENRSAIFMHCTVCRLLFLGLDKKNENVIQSVSASVPFSLPKIRVIF